ncbi:MAG: CaiB/BaiF CoA-transferase family protein [Peptococcaceae bacterium]
MTSPLNGCKVLDLTQWLPGPYCSMFLADFGAEVIKVEQPGSGDRLRWEPPLVKDTGGKFLTVNRNKLSIALNLRAEKGQEVFHRLVKESDVVLEGFRPGVAKRYKADYETLKHINPRLIYCSVSGYGQDGPYAQFPGHDINYLGYAGVLGMVGQQGKAPALSGVQVADIGGGTLMATIGILLALLARQQTNKGQFVDISMLDGAVAWLPVLGGTHFVDNIIPERGKTWLTGKYAYYEVYETSDGQYITLGAVEPHFWANLCRFLEKEELIPLQSVDEKQDEVRSIIQAEFKKKSRDEWVKIFKEIDTCAGPVYSLPEAFNDPQVLYRKMIFEMEHPRLGTIKQLGFPIKLSETPAEAKLPPPELGEHTESVLLRLGYAKEDIDNFKKDGII